MVILADLYTSHIVKDGYKFSKSGVYYAPEHTDYNGYLDYISKLPILSQPEAFGLHENADINKDLKEVDTLLESLMLTQSRDSASTGKSKEEIISEVGQDILDRLPAAFDIEAVQRKYPQDYFESMNTVLVQELGRFNGLLNQVQYSTSCRCCTT